MLRLLWLHLASSAAAALGPLGLHTPSTGVKRSPHLAPLPVPRSVARSSRSAPSCHTLCGVASPRSLGDVRAASDERALPLTGEERALPLASLPASCDGRLCVTRMRVPLGSKRCRASSVVWSTWPLSFTASSWSEPGVMDESKSCGALKGVRKSALSVSRLGVSRLGVIVWRLVRRLVQRSGAWLTFCVDWLAALPGHLVEGLLGRFA
mmetsp:Transcript_87778/g.226236  ORF Transcript_87778/g.226236 Transcript_87778/m.226236 type:complete len:209 (-) Transcript_87778:1159-1785(-)